uniref:Uncharacterized protein n=1 Tax=Thermosporothrix sp. COM3 TaxID=2490863 RepID=A0A455SLB5_9CHLR|nr:hypothetical protein KTC_32570 [Thermosporothrix sp. COM3]
MRVPKSSLWRLITNPTERRYPFSFRNDPKRGIIHNVRYLFNDEQASITSGFLEHPTTGIFIMSMEEVFSDETI